MYRTLSPILLLVAACVSVEAQSRFRVQFFHDEDRSAINFTDIAFANAKVGIAVGVLSETGKRPQGIAMLTKDGGENWQRVKLEDFPVALQVLDEANIFLLGARGIWKTEERGLTWRKLKGAEDLIHLHFLTPLQGFAAGANKRLISTDDGGKTWKDVPEAKKPSANAAFTSYNWIAFQNAEQGIVLGGATPPRRSQLKVPEWADPEAAQSEREWPTLSITLETRDGGKTWTHQTAPVFGQLSRVRFFPKSQYGLSLIRYQRAFTTPSEVFLINLRTGKSESAYKEPTREATDVAMLSPTVGMIAAIERPGTMRLPGVSGKLRILMADGLRAWKEVPVDYRATGMRAILASVDEQNVWVALDSGMILKLQSK